ncbi:MAG: DUF29 domain-containing protein [Prochlorothrix sp.]
MPTAQPDMRPEPQTDRAALYELDYQCWLDRTVAQLRARDLNSLDWENLIEELESLGKRDKRAIVSYLMRLCEHLLKLQYWQTERENCFRGWAGEVRNFRLQIRSSLADSPSLKAHLKAAFLEAYRDGRNLFLDRSGLDATLVPEEPPFTLVQALNEAWLPWKPQIDPE